MRLIITILFWITVLCFIPIPIKIKGLFNPDDYFLKVYSFTIFKKGVKLPPKKEEETLRKTKNETKETPKKDKSSIFKAFKDRINPLILYRLIRDNNFKPRLRVKGYFQYSLGDAANTAISYGALSAIAPWIYRGITLFFRSKHFYFPLEPMLNKESYINIKADCIIFISIAHIINILYIILKSIFETQEDILNEQ